MPLIAPPFCDDRQSWKFEPDTVTAARCTENQSSQAVARRAPPGPDDEQFLNVVLATIAVPRIVMAPPPATLDELRKEQAVTAAWPPPNQKRLPPSLVGPAAAQSVKWECAMIRLPLPAIAPP
eukprot:3380479-Rhodomonas_salina.1